jgi:hemerythrin HHE cation binding domain-containing protein
MDIVETLLGKHGALYAQFDHVEATIPRLSLGALKAQAEVLAAALQSHSTLEDELLFTALEPILGVGSPELVGMRMMHEDIDRGIEACRAAMEITQAQGQLLGVVELARQHFLGEEQTLFPTARQRVPQGTRDALGAAWASRRGVMRLMLAREDL